MSNLTDFFPSGGGGGLTPKFEEFNASGTFTPSQALIDAGGYIEVFLVGAGASPGTDYDSSASGAEVLMKKMYLTSASNVTVIIAGGVSTGAGGNSSFLGSTAGGYDLVSLGGYVGGGSYNGRIGNGWGAGAGPAGPGVLGYGVGSRLPYVSGSVGINTPKANSGSAGAYNATSGSGYCLIKWYE